MLFKGIYTFVIYCGIAIYHLAGLFNKKVKKAIEGRQQSKKALELYKSSYKKTIWMHCASLGEFEQGKAILDAFRNAEPNIEIIITFFSPSGFNPVSKMDIADHVFYLPFDLYSRASKLVEKIKPDIVIFVKYEFWYNHLMVINDKRIKCIFISLLMRSDHFLFRSTAQPILKQLQQVDHIFTQDNSSVDLLRQHGFGNLSRAGDTRVDGVIAIRDTQFHDEIIEEFTRDSRKTIILGSIWKADIEVISGLEKEVLKDYNWIIVPHEISKSQINPILDLFGELNPKLYSERSVSNCQALIIDKIGILKFIYRYGDIAYIGGGFGSGIHNTLEPAVYGLPVIFGPRFKKFIEAETMVNEGLFFSVNNVGDLKNRLSYLSDEHNYKKISGKIHSYFENNSRATSIIVDYIKSELK